MAVGATTEQKIRGRGNMYVSASYLIWLRMYAAVLPAAYSLLPWRNDVFQFRVDSEPNPDQCEIKQTSIARKESDRINNDVYSDIG